MCGLLSFRVMFCVVSMGLWEAGWLVFSCGGGRAARGPACGGTSSSSSDCRCGVCCGSPETVPASLFWSLLCCTRVLYTPLRATLSNSTCFAINSSFFCLFLFLFSFLLLLLLLFPNVAVLLLLLLLSSSLSLSLACRCQPSSCSSLSVLN